MKTLSFLIAGIIIGILPAPTSAQKQADIQIGKSGVGRSVRVGWAYRERPKLSLSAGAKYHLNNPDKLDSRMAYYIDRFHAEKFHEHLGLFHTLRVYVMQKKTSPFSRLFFFNTTDFNYMGYQHLTYEGYGDFDANGNQSYFLVEGKHPPILSVETCFGLGVETKITENLRLSFQMGHGILYVRDYPYVYYDGRGGSVYFTAGPGIDPTFQVLGGISYVFPVKED